MGNALSESNCILPLRAMRSSTVSRAGRPPSNKRAFILSCDHYVSPSHRKPYRGSPPPLARWKSHRAHTCRLWNTFRRLPPVVTCVRNGVNIVLYTQKSTITPLSLAFQPILPLCNACNGGRICAHYIAAPLISLARSHLVIVMPWGASKNFVARASPL
jgi:hypothetical protein